jgi:preprotein translocase subunit SecA
MKFKHSSMSKLRAMVGGLLASPYLFRGKGARRSIKSEPVRPRSLRPAARRNDPCPCGSGRKYKHCCRGRSHV